MNWVYVMYTCKTCNTVDREVRVRERRGEAEDIGHWMNCVIMAVAADHMNQHPECECETMENLKIPLPREDDKAFIGKAERTQ